MAASSLAYLKSAGTTTGRVLVRASMASNDGVQLRLGAPEQHHVRAVFGVGQGRGPTDAVAGAGDQDNPAGEEIRARRAAPFRPWWHAACS